MGMGKRQTYRDRENEKWAWERDREMKRLVLGSETDIQRQTNEKKDGRGKETDIQRQKNKMWARERDRHTDTEMKRLVRGKRQAYRDR